MNKIRYTCVTITAVTSFYMGGCGRNLNDAILLPYKAEELDKIYSRSSKGEGEDEFARNKDKKLAGKQIKEIEKPIYYTFRTAMREEEWDVLNKELPAWQYVGSKRITHWQNPNKPENELALPTHVPWLIGNYDFDAKLFEIDLPDIKTLYRRDEEKLAILMSPPWERSYGDPTPILYIDDSGTLQGGAYFFQDWQLRHDEVMQIQANKKQANKLVDQMKSLKHVKLKVFYLIKDKMCYIIKVEGYDNEDGLLFETNLNTDNEKD